MKSPFLRVMLLLIGGGLIGPSQAAGPDSYPEKPVHIIVPYPAGGSVDFLARVIQAQLQQVWGRPIIIDNRGGASGTIGSIDVARAAPDGYTLLWGNVQTHAMNGGAIKNLPYDPVKDFTPISQTTRANWIWATSPRTGVKTPEQALAAMRARPGMTYASSGNGSAAHLAFSMMARKLGVQTTHVPYKGIMQGINDVLAGNVDFVMGDQSTLLPFIKAGRLVPIAMTGNARSPLIPELPTIAETLVPGFDVQAWQGIWGPANMDPRLVERINAGFSQALHASSVVERLGASGVDAAPSSPQTFSAFVSAEYQKWVSAARDAGIVPE